ncbi:hypothetical protein B4064_3453 [Caldibacillus thermoamylovorans]|uniref:Uncharacterized protein n=1 Tax=Caldibacillus thermoamylovorans TaxID=35841 RepID=A0A0D0F7C0_9BACI|nr:hypothetical protein B4064_3453 [Caldibacillus thermoamylovorans]KIO65375.1 hypothetical protein B4065_2590 [Caldibacillus thermoamylovorans]KIO69877.1 hypothetical protein B4166_1754 [Caldibacillus thermoamylovorans]KIO73245.1 hypothetical protein B4167_2291 [Caldibacillus thermoamylovorans]
MGASVLEKSMVKRLSGTFPQAVFILENKRGGWKARDSAS